MTVTPRRFGDRRLRPRFEIMGPLWGTVETIEPLRLVNLSPGGALLKSNLPLAVDSVQRIRVNWDGEAVDQQVRVLHRRPVPTPWGERFLVGVEFLAERSPFEERLARLMSPGS